MLRPDFATTVAAQVDGHGSEKFAMQTSVQVTSGFSVAQGQGLVGDARKFDNPLSIS